MIIKGNDYEFRQLDDASPFWDVYILKVIRPKDCQPREELTNVGYGCSLPSAIRKVINYRINKKYYDVEDTISLDRYLKEYQKAVDELSNLCKEEQKTIEKDL